MMINPKNILGVSVDDPRFLEFWGEKDIDMSYVNVDGEFLLSKPKKGVSIEVNQDLKISAIMMFSGPVSSSHEDFLEFSGLLPDGLQFGMRRATILELFGDPFKENREFSVFLGVGIRPWMKYSRLGYDLTIGFDATEAGVVEVSIMLRN